jgi:transcriptional regulator with XRE-family HTH domain
MEQAAENSKQWDGTKNMTGSLDDLEREIFSPRTLSAKEVGALVRGFRELREWTQETLAELAGVSAKTVQRVERAQAGDADTLRSLAGALGFEDLNFFTKPQPLPTKEQLKQYEAKLDAETVLVKFTLIERGKQLRQRAEEHDARVIQCQVENDGLEVAFAALCDLVGDYIDIAGDITQTERLAMDPDFDEALHSVKALGGDVLIGSRRVKMSAHGADGGYPCSVLYLVCVKVPGTNQSMRVARRLAC